MTALETQLYEALDSIIGEAGFEGLPETKQEAIHAVLEEYERQRDSEKNFITY